MSQIEELRQIIIGDNSEQLTELKNRLESLDRRTRDVAEVLPPAIDASLGDGGRLIASLKEPVSQSLKAAIRNEPKAYAEILYPVMAPSIRRAISQAISSLLVTINRTVESATSVKGLSLRFESLRTGIPYAELALRKSVVYRVEHVYLMDRDTGLLIEEVTSQNAQNLDADAVSAMFSAIQSFVQDSFSRDENAKLTSFKVGEHNVWVAHGGKVMLACVIYGDAPESLKEQLYDTLDVIRTDYATQVAEFEGDASIFINVHEHLKPLLQLQLKNGSGISGRPTGLQLLPLVLVGAGLAYLAFNWMENVTRLKAVEHYLREAPGVAVTSVHWKGDQIVVEGLQDPDAQIPFGLLRSYDINEDVLMLNTIPFRSLEPAMELQRFKGQLVLPEGVQLGRREGTIYLYGNSPIGWLLDNNNRIRQLSADGRLDVSNLSASPESVRELLSSEFPVQANDLAVTIDEVDGVMTIEISGELPTDQLSLLNTVFAASNWVMIKVVAAD